MYTLKAGKAEELLMKPTSKKCFIRTHGKKDDTLEAGCAVQVVVSKIRVKYRVDKLRFSIGREVSSSATPLQHLYPLTTSISRGSRRLRFFLVRMCDELHGLDDKVNKDTQP
ncbi:hypothetical protein DsansV1_C39g0236841 [Dioscorea sansibarensis]